MLAVAFLVLKTTSSPAKMGIVLFCSVFPGMLLGFITGAFLDRYSRKSIIVGADVARGLIVSVVCILFYLEALSFPMLLAVQDLISACTAFFDPAIPAVIPKLLSVNNCPGQIPRPNLYPEFLQSLDRCWGD